METGIKSFIEKIKKRLLYYEVENQYDKLSCHEKKYKNIVFNDEMLCFPCDREEMVVFCLDYNENLLEYKKIS